MSSVRNHASTGRYSRSDLVAWRNAIFAIFGLCGLGSATWMSRNPAIRDLLQATTGQMGLLVFGLAAGSLAGLGLSSQVIHRFGPGRTMAGCLVVAPVGLAVAAVLVATTGSLAAVMLALAVFGVGFGMCDVAMNVDGAAVERELGRTVMPLFHAAFSFGTMAGAGLGALAERLHIPVLTHTVVVMAVVLVAGQVAVRFLQPHPPVESDDASGSDSSPGVGWRARVTIWRDPRTLMIGLIVLGMAFAEGSANDWLPLASVDGHGATKAAGAFMLGVFLTAMTVGRIVGVVLLDRFGRVPVLRISAAFAVAGLLMFILAGPSAMAMIGVLLWGLGSSLGFPVGMSAAADDPKVAAIRVSAVAMIGYFAFLVGPPLIGFLGQHVGLLHALLVVLVMVAVAGLCSSAARESRNVRSTSPGAGDQTQDPAGDSGRL